MNYENYARIRDSKGLKDFDVSKASGIGSSTFSDWKHGRSIPKEPKLEKIANVLGVTTYELKTGNKPEVPDFDIEHIGLVNMFSQLTEGQQEHIMNTMKLFLDGNK